MNSEKLDLAHKDLLYARLRAVNTLVSEYSFANLFLFRKAHDYEVVFDRDIFIKGRTYDGHSYLMPTREIGGMDPAYLAGMMSSVDFLFPVPEDWAAFFSPGEFTFAETRGEMDYVYTVERMSTLRGRDLAGKRNLIRQFAASYRHEARPLTEDLLGDALSVLDQWQARSGLRAGDTDYGPCLEALRLYESLVLCGGIYYADDKPAGFILGEELNEETFVLHFAKALTGFKGIYQYMFNNFSKILPPKYRFLNFEQDLENAALRIAKSSYRPEKMLRKLRVGLKGRDPAGKAG